MCDKHPFASRREANIHVKKIKQHSKRDKVPQRAYFCVECDCYHITSIREERSESEEHKRGKKTELRKFKYKGK